ncbi:two-component system, NarL family, nitrate/nitrite response regulator NarL [Microbacterium sp. cf046]|uniref:response regulator transcription factor n=1 Tax=Microbacterium sp. cf046 TaxID=1761803 RepID=UPI0008EC4497|nr:response regulator transcription factor [Microbacterium sp. cf046]SFS07580.1 two-component system, NarL family, nitrate/nitrite response regulator NarL [Microbacterium sp. cf046]
MGIEGDGAYGLVVTGEPVRADYVRLLGRLGMSADAFADSHSAAAALRDHAPVVAILEVEHGGCELLRELRDQFGSDLPVVLVSADRTAPADVVAGLLVGADDYAAESMDADEFLARVRRLIDRTGRAPHATADLRRLSALTDRERQVLGLLTDGRSHKQVASELGISVKTVGTHVQNLLSKLGLHTRVEAVALAVRAGELGPSSLPARVG